MAASPPAVGLALPLTGPADFDESEPLRLDEPPPSPLDQLTLGAGEVADAALLHADGVLAAWEAEDDGFVPRPAHYCHALAEALRRL